jgi:hypothetical protein
MIILSPSIDSDRLVSRANDIRHTTNKAHSQAMQKALNSADHVKKKRPVYICDWLPPEFGAVGQFAMLSAREWAKSGWEVTLVGLTSGEPRRQPAETIEEGTLDAIRCLVVNLGTI